MGADLLDVRDRIVERVATLLAMDTPQVQIAAATGLSEGRISQLAHSDQVLARKAEILSEKLEQHEELNSGWDAIEEESMATVLEYVSVTKDPEFALRAAKVANSANRRGGYNGAPINGNANAAAVINLSAIFVEKLQNMRVGPAEISAEAHRRDALPVANVERLLQDDVKISMKEIFGERLDAS
jgi:hypothetical protein